MNQLFISLVLLACSIPALAQHTFEVPESELLESVNETLGEGASPFYLAHKYRFSACNERQGAVARAVWIVETAYAAGEISRQQFESDSFLNDVTRFIRGLCSNKR